VRRLLSAPRRSPDRTAGMEPDPMAEAGMDSASPGAP